MTRKEFAEELGEILELDTELTMETDLTQFEEFDSLAMLSIIAMIYQNFEKRIPGMELAKVTTVQSLVDLIGNDRFE